MASLTRGKVGEHDEGAGAGDVGVAAGFGGGAVAAKPGCAAVAAIVVRASGSVIAAVAAADSEGDQTEGGRHGRRRR